ncbi:MAG: hypothetical protein JO217_11615, partial [Acidobacteriaceae bacterium]|nr:hypothetical protein [Acidobacteriaceae bacterium]
MMIGIGNDTYAFPEDAAVWITGPTNPENRNHTAFNYRAIARLKPRVSLAQANAELGRICEQDKRFRKISLQDDVAGPARTTLLFLPPHWAVAALSAQAPKPLFAFRDR